MFSQQPTATTVGSTIAPAIVVEFETSSGQLDASQSGTVALTLTNPGNATEGVNAVLQGTLSATAVGGLATFSTVSVTQPGVGFTLQAGSGSLSVISAPFSVAQTPTHLAFQTQPANAAQGAVITPAVTVEVLDKNDALVTSATNTVNLTLSGGSGTLGGSASAAAVSGIATFSTLTVSQAGTGYTLSAASTGLVGTTSSPFTIASTVSVASQVAFVQQPTSTTVGSAITPPIQVAIEDASGTVVTSSTATVTLSILANPGAATLSGTSAAAVNGVATFSGTSLNHAGSGYTLQAASTGLSSSPSSTFNITTVVKPPTTFVDSAGFTPLGLSGFFGTNNTNFGNNSILAADFTGTGKNDIVQLGGGGGDGGEAILVNGTAINATTPVFSLVPLPDASSFIPEFMTVADINGDGKPDLVAAVGGNPAQVAVFLNTTPTGATTPTFASPQIFNLPYNAGLQGVGVGDFNGDGKMDMAVTFNTEAVAGFSVLLNTTPQGSSTVSFAAAQSTTYAGGGGTFAVADFNQDGLADIVTALPSGATHQSIAIFLNTTTPGSNTVSFSQTNFAPLAPISNFNSMTAVDLNGDGVPDILFNSITVNGGEGPNAQLVTFINTTPKDATTPTLGADTEFEVGISTFHTNGLNFNTGDPQGLVAADFNGDGLADVAVMTSTNGGEQSPDQTHMDVVTVLVNTTPKNATTASFGTATNVTIPENSGAITAADFNGDGKNDLAIGPFINPTMVLLNNTTTGASQASFIVPQNPGLANQTSAQVAGTGPLGGVLIGGTDAVAYADFNGDGKNDLVSVNSSANNDSTFNASTVTVSLNQGGSPPTFNSASFTVGQNAIAVLPVDINGDGSPDIVTVNEQSGDLSVLINQTATGATTPAFTAATTISLGSGSEPFSIATADINGDGKPDLVVALKGGQGVVVLLNTTPTGSTTPSFASPLLLSTGSGSSPTGVACADINGDTLPDVIVTDGQHFDVFINQTTRGASTASFGTINSFSESNLGFTNNAPFTIASVDMNGDGKPDVIIGDLASGVAVVLNTTPLGSSTPTFNLAQTSYVTVAGGNNSGQTTYPGSLVVADVNGDGIPDIEFEDPLGYYVIVITNQTAPGATSTTFTLPQYYGTDQEPVGLTVVDLVGNGKPALVTANAVGAFSNSAGAPAGNLSIILQLP